MTEDRSWTPIELSPEYAPPAGAFLSTLEGANTGDVLTIDNEGRRDEACIGDLIALEAAAAGLAGIVVRGARAGHRRARCSRPTGLLHGPMPRRSEGLANARRLLGGKRPARLGARVGR